MRETKKQKALKYLQLLIALGLLIILIPIVESRESSGPSLAGFAIAFFFLFFLFTALRAVVPQNRYFRWAVRILAGIAFLTTAPEMLARETTPWVEVSGAVSAACYTVLLLFLTIFIVKDLFSGHQVSADKIYGSIVGYLLIGLLWAFIFLFITGFIPGAIVDTEGDPIIDARRLDGTGGRKSDSTISAGTVDTDGDPIAPENRRTGTGGRKGDITEVIYFSYTTLATLGYGDIVAVHPLAMTLANIEAIVGQFFIAILVARLVGLQIIQSYDRKDRPASSSRN